MEKEQTEGMTPEEFQAKLEWDAMCDRGCIVCGVKHSVSFSIDEEGFTCHDCNWEQDADAFCGKEGCMWQGKLLEGDLLDGEVSPRIYGCPKCKTKLWWDHPANY